MRLTTKVHDRDVAGLTYVYPVVSRRAGGVSVGINLNPNNACNWRCVYCQVPNLTRGKGPAIDLALLERELEAMLGALVHGDYMRAHVPEGSRHLIDIAFSGNGEPTSSGAFDEAVALALDVLARYAPESDPTSDAFVRRVVISNGSLVHQPEVQRALARLGDGGGELWFKLDSATDAGQQRLNDEPTGVDRTRRNLHTALDCVPTWLQTMMLAWKGAAPSEDECAAYLDLVAEVAGHEHLRGVLLYGLARKSYQPEAPSLSPLPAAWMEAFAARIESVGVPVRVSL